MYLTGRNIVSLTVFHRVLNEEKHSRDGDGKRSKTQNQTDHCSIVKDTSSLLQKFQF